jgi:HrpA-like RNA helicase
MRESVMADHLEPEIRRIELSEPALTWHVFFAEGFGSDPAKAPLLQWPTAPEASRWARAEAKLTRISALHSNRITTLGRALLSWPAAPELARVLHDAAASPDKELKRQVAAMAAVLSSGRRTAAKSPDLFVLGEELAAEPRNADRESAGAFQQFLGILERNRPPQSSLSASEPGDDPATLRERVAKLFLAVFADKIAARLETGNSFQLADGRKGVAAVPASVTALLALEIHESGGKDRAKQTTLPLVVPVDPEWVRAEFPGLCEWKLVEDFDEKAGRQRREERLMFQGLVLARREKALPRGADASEALVEKLRSGEIELPFDDDARQLLLRIKLAHKLCPESGMPELGDEDWELLWHEAAQGKKSLKQLQDVNVSSLLREYLGYSLTAFLDKEAPTSAKLPGPRRGKITYFEKTPPELSARLGDFVGMQGRFKILMGRQDVTFDILAPNYRTVQKTSDLTSFWSGSYIEIKKELKRRYPRHPWP